MSSSHDPAVADRVATTLAILRVNHEQQATYLGSYLPFLYHCLCLSTEAPVATKPLQSQLKSEFGLDLPLGVIRSLLRDAVSEGKVREEHRLYFRVEQQLQGCDLNPARVEFSRRFSALATSLRTYSEEHYGLIWQETDAKEFLLSYADGFSSDILAAAIGGRAIPEMPPRNVSPDVYVVHKFTANAYEGQPDNFDFLVGLIKARMLSDSLHFDIGLGQEPTLAGVEIYFDGPILLYALGNAGEEIRAPYAELIAMLKGHGAELRCFHHSVTEAQQILDVAAARTSTATQGEQYYGDVVGFLVRSDRSRTDIELQAEHLEQDLKDLGIVTVDTPGRVNVLQPDEEAIESLIQEYIPTIRRPALLRDVDSLTAIHRLRNGKTPRTIASSRAILVTHNYALFRASARFFNQRRSGRSVPHCVHDASFTTLVWLHEPKRYPDLPREFVLANATAATQPSEPLWKLYNSEIDTLYARGAINEDDIRFLRYSGDANSLLMDLTRGDSAAFTDATMSELLELYRRRAVRHVEETVREVRDELTDEQAAHLVTRRQIEDTRDRVKELSQRAASVLANCLFVILIMALLLGAVFGPVGPIKGYLPGLVQALCAALAVGFGVWSLINGASIRGVRDSVEKQASTRIEAILVWVFRLS